jgi:hypothetical protein
MDRDEEGYPAIAVYVCNLIEYLGRLLPWLPCRNSNRSSASATLVSSSTPLPSPLRVLCGIWHCAYQWFGVSPLVIWGPGLLVNIIHDDGLWMASSYCYWILCLLEWNDYSMVAAKQTMSV